MNVRLIDRIFSILELLAKEQNGLNLTEIGKKIDLHKSTVYRLLAVLQKRGYINKDPQVLTYNLGSKFIELSSQYLNKLELRTEADPVLRKLSQQTKLTVFLATLNENQVNYVDKVEQFNVMRKYSVIGMRNPLYCTALGKALLSGMDECDIKQIYKNKKFKSYTKNTAKNVTALLKMVAETRQRGWSMDNEEFESGVQCIGAPIFDYRGNVIAAVSTSWFMNKVSNINFEEIGQYVHQAGLEISMNLGYRNIKITAKAGRPV